MILHTNDVRAQLVSPADAPGGAARRAALIGSVKGRFPSVVVDAGDALGPSAISSWDRGETAARVMKMSGYDALAPGNRDFDFGVEAVGARRTDAGFAFLCANVSGPGNPFTPEAIYDRGGVRIGVFGLLWPDIAAKVSRTNLGGLSFSDPVSAAASAVERLRSDGADYVIGLVHASGPSALALVRSVAGIDLVVAGGYSGQERAGSVPVRTETMDGTLLVTVPMGGGHVGRVDVDFVTDDAGSRPIGARATLLPVDGAPDPDVRTFIRERLAEFRRETGREVGAIAAESAADQARILCALMRRHVNAEVGVLNLGAVEKVPAGTPLKLRQISRLVRFDDSLVRLKMTGRQLRAIVSRGKRASGNAALVYSGLDPDRTLINGRPVYDQEVYQVVTTAYLADGGDGYDAFREASDVTHTGILIRSLVVAAMEAWGRLELHRIDVDARGVWRTAWSLEGSFNRNYVDETTNTYRDRGERVSFLSGNTTVAWKTSSRLAVGYDVGRHVWDLENRAEFGQIGAGFDDLEKSADVFESDLTYRYRANLRLDPFASVGLGTAFTRSGTLDRRPLLIRASTGFQRRIHRLLTARVGARAQRDFTVDETDLGAEISLESQMRFRGDGRLSARVKSFFGLTDRRVVSIENYNTLTFPLIGNLSLAIRQSNFLYRVNQIQEQPVSGVAVRTDLTIGFVYGRDWKWY